MNHFRLFKDVPKIRRLGYRFQLCGTGNRGAFDVHVELSAPQAQETVLRAAGKIGSSSFSQDITLAVGEKQNREFATEVDWRELHRLLKVSFPYRIIRRYGINEMQFGYVGARCTGQGVW